MVDRLGPRDQTRPPETPFATKPSAHICLADVARSGVNYARKTQAAPSRLSASDRRIVAAGGFHERHMPIELLKFPIPRKNKEKRALFQSLNIDSREHKDMMTILTSSYIDGGSTGSFTYCKPQLIHSELLEKEFVEKRKEMKADGRTDKELEESFFFLLTDSVKVHNLCEKGLFVGQSWITLLGNPSKGVYLSRYSDLLQVNPIIPGATGEILIFKVMKGKVKSICGNIKNLLDPTPHFDSHISQNTSKVTSLTSYHALELTQQYFYEYRHDELRQRPRQVCPYAVVSFQFKGKDSLLSKTVLPISNPTEGSKEHPQYTVWTGDLMKGDRILFQISLCSFSAPFLPCRLPEKLEIGQLMRLDHVTNLLPPDVFSCSLYNSSQEVVRNGHYCSLLKVTDRGQSTATLAKLLHDLEMKRMVLVTPLIERGFLFLLSSVQMATPTERGERWERCLQALFVFPESRGVIKSKLRCTFSSCDALDSMSGCSVMPWLSRFIPALHFALVEAHTNPSPDMSAGVQCQATEYLMGLNDSCCPMGKYDSKMDEQGKQSLTPKYKANMDGCLKSYLFNPTSYELSVAQARSMVEAHCGLEQHEEVRPTNSSGNQKEVSKMRDKQVQSHRAMTPGRKRQLEQEPTEWTPKSLKTSQEPGTHRKIVVTGLNPTARGSASLIKGQKEQEKESCPFDRLATNLGLSTRCDIDLRKQDHLEVAMIYNKSLTWNCLMVDGVSNLEGFSLSCQSRERYLCGAAPRGGGRGRRARGYEEERKIPWILIPITGVSSGRYTHRDGNIPQDPRFQRLNIITTTHPPQTDPTASTKLSSPSLSECPSPEPNELMKNEEKSAQSPCISPLKWRTSTSLLLREYEKERESKTIEVKKEPPKEEEKQAWTVNRMQKQREEHNVVKKEEVQVVDWVRLASGEEEQKEGGKELVGGPLFSPVSSSTPSDLPRHIDNILGESLDSFLFEVQCILQEESIPYSLQHSPHSTVNPDITELQYLHSQTAISQFSQYMSLNSPCFAVQKYIVQLQDGINAMVPELDHSWLRDKPSTSNSNTAMALASEINAFVPSNQAVDGITDRADE